MPLAALNVTVKFMVVEPLSPSFTLGEEIDSVGGSSSSVMAPVPTPAVLEIAAFAALLRLTRMVSSTSSVASPVTNTAMVLLVSPAAKVKVLPVMAV